MKNTNNKRKKNAAQKWRNKRLEREYNWMKETQYFSSMFICMIAALSLHLITHITGYCYNVNLRVHSSSGILT